VCHSGGRQFILHFADQMKYCGIVEALACHRERRIACGLGNPEIDGIDQRQRDHSWIEMKGYAPFAGGSSQQQGRVGHEDVLDDDVVRAGPAHTERAPVVLGRDAPLRDRDRELQDGRARVRIVVDRLRHEQVAGGNAAGKNLASVDPPAVLDAFGRS
jgi:hypothetical protein